VLNVEPMRYSLIKWFGTILIILAGIFIAANLTYKWKVSEYKVYKLSLPEYTFALKDSRQISLTMSFMFMDKQVAQDVSEKRVELVDTLNKFFSTIESTKFDTADHIEELKTQVLLALKAAKYPVQYISFDAQPRLL
jgi:flagellar basal body-associated protein FliL